MKLSWSHAVLYVREPDKMIDFYTRALGFALTDRGPLGKSDGPEIMFFSQEPEEHHQVAMITTRKDETPSNTVNHFAFRVDEFEEVRQLARTLAGVDGVKVAPLSHGNTLSIYFNDPEGNGLEVFWDTPWHVAQPQGQPWDLALAEDDALAWVKSSFGGESSFVPREEFYGPRRG